MSTLRAALMRVTLFATLASIGWLLLWEIVVAPLRPGGSLLALKAIPLALCVPALMRDSRRARQWLALLLPWYFAEALVRALTGQGRAMLAAIVAAVLLATAFLALLATFRIERAGTAHTTST